MILQKAYGTLKVVTEPPGAAVALDDRPVPGVTPLSDLSVQADIEHTLSARMDGWEPANEKVTVRENERRELSLKLREFGILELETTPDEAGVWLDDEYVGTTPAEIFRPAAGA